MSNSLVSLTKQFIALQSTPDNPRALTEVLELALKQLDGFTIERFEHGGAHSALVYTGEHRPPKFTILLNGHLDIIPAKHHQHTPNVVGDKLYGAGALDMKASVACLIQVFREVAPQVAYPLALQLTTDEEIGGFHGTKHQIEEGVRADFVIAGEPTNLNIVHEAKGILQAKITAPGTTAHGAYPWRGENAIWEMHDFLSALKERYPLPDSETNDTTVNVSRIETDNGAFNKIPDSCSVWLDVRFSPQDADSITDDLQSLLPAGFTLDVLACEPPLATDANNTFIRQLTKTMQNLEGEVKLRSAHGTSDARHFTPVGGAGIEFGPIGHGIGSDDEWVDIPSLDYYCRILTTFLLAVR